MGFSIKKQNTIKKVQRAFKTGGPGLHGPVTIQEMKKVVAKYIDYYNNDRLHSGIEYMRPADKQLQIRKDYFLFQRGNLSHLKEARHKLSFGRNVLIKC